jgi:hypothetical protein
VKQGTRALGAWLQHFSTACNMACMLLHGLHASHTCLATAERFRHAEGLQLQQAQSAEVDQQLEVRLALGVLKGQVPQVDADDWHWSPPDGVQ